MKNKMTDMDAQLFWGGEAEREGETAPATG